MNRQKIRRVLDQTKDIYNRIAPDFSDTRSHWWKGFGDFAKYVRPGDRVLDLGCGNGRMAEIFTDSKVRYLGIDNSEELIKIAQERFKDKPWVKFEVGDITAFVIPSEVEKSFGNESDSSAPLRSGRNDKEDKRSGRNDKEDKRSSGNDNTKNGFDLVLLVAVLHHLPTKKLRLKVLENIHQALKPGGRLVMVNWNLWQIFGWKKKFRYWPYLFNWPEKIKCGVWGVSDAFVPWKPAGKETRRYIHSFTKGETRRLLRRAGFAIEELEFKAKGDNKKGIMYGDNLLSIAVKNGKM